MRFKLGKKYPKWKLDKDDNEEMNLTYSHSSSLHIFQYLKYKTEMHTHSKCLYLDSVNLVFTVRILPYSIHLI